MGIKADSLGATAGPKDVSWTDRETLLYALGLGAGPEDLAFVTENSHDLPQQVLPTFAVIVAAGFDALPKIGRPNWGRMLHGSQEIRVHRPLPAAGSLAVTSEIGELQDKGEGKNAVASLIGRGVDPETGELVVETVTTLVFRGEGGFGGEPGAKADPVVIPDRAPDARRSQETDARLPLIYRLSGDRNPLHSDPWFAREKAGFPGPILHGLCTYGIAGRALVADFADGDPDRIGSIAARFTSPAFPGDTLTTLIWKLDDGTAVFRTEATGPDGAEPRVVLDGGRATLRG
ncbi:MaoC family dehydratase [Pseudonocardia acidicola]|uniref:Dehydrogenase n=1 Tax=Pseudonocardia acidicola TaxID=2724939 RepID=A0ABX1SCH8_9PSEU|nr:MaoC family dehydratase [Pseudonocardia acidicola]NMH98208.1 dehydrogenase [Pseudonocardia acidicola]